MLRVYRRVMFVGRLGRYFAYADNFSRENGSMLGQVVVVVPWYWRAMVPSDGWHAAIMLESVDR